MRHPYGRFVLAIALGFGVGGCGVLFGTGNDFKSNDLARQLLGNSLWGDTGGSCQLVFNEDARLVGVQIPDLPAELANIDLTGEPFEIALPSDLPVLGGETISASASSTGTFLQQDENGDYQVEMHFRGDLGGIPLAALVDHVDVVFKCTANEDGTELSNLGADLSVIGPFGITLYDLSKKVDLTVPLTRIE